MSAVAALLADRPAIARCLPWPLERRLERDGMIPLDPWAMYPPDLPEGARVEILTHDGRLLPWEWADGASWWAAAAWRTVPGGSLEHCSSCGQFTADLCSEHCSVCAAENLCLCSDCFGEW